MSRLTVLDCQVGNHTGHFEISKTTMGWACPKCIEKLRLQVSARFATHPIVKG